MTSKLLRTWWFTRSNAVARGCRFLNPAQTWLSLLLIFALLWPLSGVRFDPPQVSESVALLNDDLPQLDSFSGPDVAAAILQQHVENLYLAYVLTNEAHWIAGGNSAIRKGKAPNPLASTGDGLCAIDRAKEEQVANGQTLWALDRRLRGLRAELLQNLLAIHYQIDHGMPSSTAAWSCWRLNPTEWE